MTMVVVLFLVFVLLLVWLAFTAPGCKHTRARGVANYYDEDLRVFLHLKECEDCGDSFITRER
jgi:hypothetical protein